MNTMLPSCLRMITLDRFVHKTLGVPYRLHVRTMRRVKKPRATLLFLHGIGSSGAEWHDVIEKLPDDVTIITVDMLGFGKSPRPEWARYSADEQARSVIATLLRAGITQRLIVVGHSLGALVSVEIAKRYPLLVRSLVLCSPPFYNPDRDGALPNVDRLMTMIYGQVEHNQETFLRLAELAIEHDLVNSAFHLDQDTLPTYIQTLKATIMSQSAYEDIQKLRIDITIIYGSLDPFVIDRNLKSIAKANPKVTLARVLVGHEIIGRFIPKIVQRVEKHINAVEV